MPLLTSVILTQARWGGGFADPNHAKGSQTKPKENECPVSNDAIEAFFMIFLLLPCRRHAHGDFFVHTFHEISLSTRQNTVRVAQKNCECRQAPQNIDVKSSICRTLVTFKVDFLEFVELPSLFKLRDSTTKTHV